MRGSYFKYRLIIVLVVIVIGYGSVNITNWMNSSKNKAVEFCNRGVEQVKSGEVDKAIVNFDEAIKLYPECIEAWTNKGAALCMKEKFEEGLKCLDKALELNPEHPSALKAKGLAYHVQGKYDQAIIYFDRALKVSPGDGNIQNLKSEAEKKYKENL